MARKTTKANKPSRRHHVEQQLRATGTKNSPGAGKSKRHGRFHTKKAGVFKDVVKASQR